MLTVTVRFKEGTLASRVYPGGYQLKRVTFIEVEDSLLRLCGGSIDGLCDVYRLDEILFFEAQPGG